MSAWENVMGAFYKQSAKRIEHKKVVKERHEKVYGNIDGTKMECSEIKEIFDAGGIIIDLRNPVDYISGGMVHNSVNVPHKNVLKWVTSNDKITENTPILLYSINGRTSQTIMEDLSTAPFNYKNVHNIGASRWYPKCSA